MTPNLHSVQRRAQTAAVCSSDFVWMQNGLQQSPCLVAAFSLGACTNGNWNVPALPNGTKYDSPNATTANPCSCSWTSYNLLSACALCQNQPGGYDTWSAYVLQCPSIDRTNNTYWPSSIAFPSAAAIPFYASQNPLDWPNSRFDLNTAHSIANEGHADLTGQAPSSPQKSSNIGPIIGGVVGGVVIIILAVLGIWLYNKRKRLQAATAAQDGHHYMGGVVSPHPVDGIYTDGQEKTNGYMRLQTNGSPITVGTMPPNPPMSPATVQTHHTHNTSGGSLSYFGGTPIGHNPQTSLSIPGSPSPAPGGIFNVFTSTPTSTPPPRHGHSNSAGSNPENQIQPFTLIPSSSSASPNVNANTSTNGYAPDRKGGPPGGGPIYPVYSSPSRPPDEHGVMSGETGVPGSSIGLGTAGTESSGPSEAGGSSQGRRERLNPPPYSPDGYAGPGVGAGAGMGGYSSGVVGQQQQQRRQTAQQAQFPQQQQQQQQGYPVTPPRHGGGGGDVVLASTPMRPEKSPVMIMHNRPTSLTETATSSSGSGAGMDGVGGLRNTRRTSGNVGIGGIPAVQVHETGSTTGTGTSLSGIDMIPTLGHGSSPAFNIGGGGAVGGGAIGTGLSGLLQANSIQPVSPTGGQGGFLRPQVVNPDPSVDGRSVVDHDVEPEI
ncbi:hypothetical protein BDN72DRAFT_856009 [Pluteus cervinus]|uniref:Uncharacterized protein n=1 Tax=Pluteus cervinus TaxID=181527 RepID=A0ACD3B255_9AGAR|nr:hypothetical protein BDN72DRAFT_856009 [Pluteus cervinus]